MSVYLSSVVLCPLLFALFQLSGYRRLKAHKKISSPFFDFRASKLADNLWTHPKQ
ncbi:MAG: hypothetical protein ACR2HG_15045 [Pyrinomonadaceae bacterium]